ncbi:sugar-transfer associated ATP-grasp domain-containing protein [Winogradskyella vincentii]|uniref:Alpha-L-glutamate ligase-related protein ATP-grasp domain-containing protein n=1 Tax=Winogradskyella vincentii TaxID=2877122 RepID=A0ABS7XZB2_9FLAO|nr:sugar-transfer associated ATP-grasp domain-containing protein [Winogradskyella vincentii]MCA0152995.1 hypothetical protein [Winogradskyella vincentii]
MKELAKSLIKKSRSYIYHKEQNATALKILKVQETQNGRLSKKERKLCIEYALDIFGHKKYAPWLMTYCSYQNQFKEGWIPDNYYGETVVPTIKGEYGRLCYRPLIVNKLINHNQDSNLGYFINGYFLDINDKIYQPIPFIEYIFQKHQKIVFKTEDSFQGRGIYIFNKNTFDLELIRKLGNGVFQGFIIQHEFFNAFNESAVATIRVTSVCNNKGEIEIRGGFFKFGRSTDSHVKTSTAIKIPYDFKTGRLYHKAFLPNWSSIDSLPDKNVDFSNMQLPNYDYCISEIKKLHKRVFYIGCIGWDITIDNNNNLRIIELNGFHNGIRFHEMTQGPCFTGLGWENLHKT